MGLGSLLKAVPVIGQAIQAAETVGSFATSLINRHAQKENNKRIAEQNAAAMDFQAEQNLQNMAFNREEAEKSRAFNAQQAQLAFEREAKFNREMWEKENAYNSPSAQVQRLIDAGVNPNVFGGQNTAGSVSAASSSAASSNPASVNLGGTPSLHSPSPVSLVNPMLEAAQIRLANASAQKAESDSNLAKTQSERLKALLAGELQLQGSTYNVQMSESMRNEASAKESLANIEKINAQKDLVFAQIDEIRQNISNLEKQGELTQKDLDSYEMRLALDLRERLSRIELNGKSALACLASASASYAAADLSRAQTSLTRKEEEKVCQDIIHQAITNDILKIDYRIKNHTETSTVVLQNKKNSQAINDISVTDSDDWRYPRLFLQTIGQVFSSNLSIK